jgi:hypothetical protein
VAEERWVIMRWFDQRKWIIVDQYPHEREQAAREAARELRADGAPGEVRVVHTADAAM